MNPIETSSVYWHFPILIVTVSLVYSATRFEKWNHILLEALHWGLRMVLFLVSIGVLLYVIPLLNRMGMVIGGAGAALLFLGYLIYTKPRPSRG